MKVKADTPAAQGFLSWLGVRCVEGETLVCPLRALWDDYLAYCRVWDFTAMQELGFVHSLGSLSYVRIVERGHGRRQRCVEGIGSRPLRTREAM
jgi:hypothetical protein